MKNCLQLILFLLAVSVHAHAPEPRVVFPSLSLHAYDGRRVIQERDGNNAPYGSYTRGNDLSGSLEGGGGIGGLLGSSHGYNGGSGAWSTHNFYHADGAGNITYLVNSSQGLAASYRYDPYGNTISSSGSLASANVYRFSSKEIHTTSGLYYYGYRFYEPNLQRWLNQDPIGELGGLNLYGYVGNDPINLIDPYGLWSFYRWLYTGDGNATDEVYDGATEAAGDYVYDYGGVRGGYAGVGYGGKAKGKGSIAGAAGLTGTWKIDDGASLSLDVGVGLQERGRNSCGRFTSQTIGVGGGYQFWNEKDGFQSPGEGIGFSGIYGGTGNKNGEVNFGIGGADNIAIGIGYGPAYGGLIVDPNRVLINFRDSFNILFH